MPIPPYSSSRPFSSDTLHVLKAGDSMTGTLNMIKNPIIFQDANGVNWSTSVNTDGSLNTIQLVHGSPMGLLIALTYP